MSSNLKCVKLIPEFNDLISLFDSGNSYIDNFLKSKNAFDDNIGKTYLLIYGNKLLGYFNISTGCLDYIEDNHRIKMGGAVHINYLALDQKYHHTKVDVSDNNSFYMSDILLDYCLKEIERLHSKEIGFSFITLSATLEGLNLYKRNGFEVLEEDMIFSDDKDEKECIDMFYNIAINDYF